MLQFSFPQPYSSLLPMKQLKNAALFGSCLLFCQVAHAAYTVSGIESETSPSGTIIRIRGSEPPTYTVYELFKPSRIVVDVANAELETGSELSLPTALGVQVKTTEDASVSPKITRFEFTLDKTVPFSETVQANDIVLTLDSSQAPSDVAQPDAAPGALIQDIQVSTGTDKTTILIQADGPLKNYQHNVLDRKENAPPRLYIDINQVKGDGLLQEKLVGTAVDKIRVASRGSGIRIVLDGKGDKLFPFQIMPVSNGLKVEIVEKGTRDQVSSLISQKSSIEGQLPQVDPLEKGLSPQATEQSLEDAFSFSGYTKERITVDFYKIDLHNVFRLIREVSNANIVVDEAVSGSLTLALDNVPWDFALDIILNLKDLQKEERFNTIVILPKDKTFAWSNKAENNLSFEADVEVTEQEALLIQQQKNIPPEVIEAKEILGKALAFEKREDFETAVRLYEDALSKWTDNAKLANKIASLYLVKLRQNAKAAFYAKKALEIDPKYSTAALNAGIALASMQEYEQAQPYFDQSVSGEKPSSEALMSYAVFSEEMQRYDGAQKLLQKHDQIYGENLNSMIASARIYDKTGETSMATEKYKAIMLSGFRIPPDLAKYIKGRLALEQNM